MSERLDAEETKVRDLIAELDLVRQDHEYEVERGQALVDKLRSEVATFEDEKSRILAIMGMTTPLSPMTPISPLKRVSTSSPIVLFMLDALSSHHLADSWLRYRRRRPLSRP